MTIRDNPPQRAPVVTDCNNPSPTLTTSLPREAYDAVGRMAIAHNLSRSAYLRRLVLEHVGKFGDGRTIATSNGSLFGTDGEP